MRIVSTVVVSAQAIAYYIVCSHGLRSSMMSNLGGIVKVLLGIHLYCCKWTCAGVNNISRYERLDMLTSWQRIPHVSANQRSPQATITTAWPACLGAASVHTYCGLPGGALAVMAARLGPSRKLQSSQPGFGDRQMVRCVMPCHVRDLDALDVHQCEVTTPPPAQSHRSRPGYPRCTAHRSHGCPGAPP